MCSLFLLPHQLRFPLLLVLAYLSPKAPFWTVSALRATLGGRLGFPTLQTPLMPTVVLTAPLLLCVALSLPLLLVAVLLPLLVGCQSDAHAKTQLFDAQDRRLFSEPRALDARVAEVQTRPL